MMLRLFKKLFLLLCNDVLLVTQDYKYKKELRQRIEKLRSYKMTQEELDEQAAMIALAEVRHCGDKNATIEDMRAAVTRVKEREKKNRSQSYA